ncbi:hypothetical protein TNCV_1730691 [Trichonephila clavipes]|nr:hypothetical protein TNCV_1730691 [Trichonephila clavipes]
MHLLGAQDFKRKKKLCSMQGKLRKMYVRQRKRWEAPGYPQDFLPLNWDGTEQNRTVTCMVLKAKANDRRKNSSP